MQCRLSDLVQYKRLRAILGSAVDGTYRRAEAILEDALYRSRTKETFRKKAEYYSELIQNLGTQPSLPAMQGVGSSGIYIRIRKTMDPKYISRMGD